MLAGDVAARHLVPLDVDAPVLRTSYGVMYARERTLAPVARAFIDSLRSVQAEIMGGSAGSA